MLYNPAGEGAGPDVVLVCRGTSWESAQRLAKQASAAAKAGEATNGVTLGHGVSVTSPDSNAVLARDPKDAVRATRKALEEAGFEVRHPQTKVDTDHHPLVLPNPVTDDVAARFNHTFGRSEAS